MQHASDAKHCRRCGAPYVYDAVYLGPPRPLPLPNGGGARAREPGVCGDATSRLDGVRGARFALRIGARAPRVALPLPGLYNVYNALGAAALATALGRRARRRSSPGCRRRAPRSAARRRCAIGGRELVDPARQEPRRRERGAAHARARARRARRARGPQRPHRRRARRLAGSGTRTSSSLAGARPARRLQRHARRRAGAAAEVRGRAAGADRRRRRRSSAALDAALADGDGPRSYALPDVHRDARAARAARRARRGAGVVRDERRRHLARRRVRPLRRRPAALARARRRGDGGPVLDVGAGTGRVALDLARRGHEVVALDLDAELLAALRARAGDLPVETVVADARDFDLGAPLRARPRADADDPAARRRRRRARLPALRARAHLAPGGLLALRDRRRARGLRRGRAAAAAARHPRASTASSTPAGRWRCATTATGCAIERVRERRERPTASAPSSDDVIRLDKRRRRAGSRPRRVGAGCRRSAARVDRRRPRSTSGIDGGDARWLTLRVCALYPDLMNIYADRGNLLMLERRCAWRGHRLRGRRPRGSATTVDPDAHDLFYLGGGQDRDQRLCAQDLVSTQARRAARGGRARARSCSASAAASSCSATATSSATSEIPGIGLVDLHTCAPRTARG